MQRFPDHSAQRSEELVTCADHQRTGMREQAPFQKLERITWLTSASDWRKEEPRQDSAATMAPRASLHSGEGYVPVLEPNGVAGESPKLINPHIAIPHSGGESPERRLELDEHAQTVPGCP